MFCKKIKYSYMESKIFKVCFPRIVKNFIKSISSLIFKGFFFEFSDFFYLTKSFKEHTLKKLPKKNSEEKCFSYFFVVYYIFTKNK